MALRWRKKPVNKSMRFSNSANRGSDLWDEKTKLASTSFSEGDSVYKKGWFWSCPSNADFDIPHMNTYHAPVETEGEAKAAAKAYIAERLHKISTQKLKDTFRGIMEL